MRKNTLRKRSIDDGFIIVRISYASRAAGIRGGIRTLDIHLVSVHDISIRSRPWLFVSKPGTLMASFERRPYLPPFSACFEGYANLWMIRILKISIVHGNYQGIEGSSIDATLFPSDRLCVLSMNGLR